MDKTCKNCIYIADETDIPFCIIKDLYTLVKPDDEACEEFLSKHKDNGK